MLANLHNVNYGNFAIFTICAAAPNTLVVLGTKGLYKKNYKEHSALLIYLHNFITLLRPSDRIAKSYCR